MFNTMIDVAFTVDHAFSNPEDLFKEENIDKVLGALEERVRYLRANKTEAAEAFGICDTIEKGDGNDTV